MFDEITTLAFIFVFILICIATFITNTFLGILLGLLFIPVCVSLLSVIFDRE